MRPARRWVALLLDALPLPGALFLIGLATWQETCVAGPSAVFCFGLLTGWRWVAPGRAAPPFLLAQAPPALLWALLALVLLQGLWSQGAWVLDAGRREVRRELGRGLVANGIGAIVALACFINVYTAGDGLFPSGPVWVVGLTLSVFGWGLLNVAAVGLSWRRHWRPPAPPPVRPRAP